jgi:RNA polymerase sigma factor (sigma-70 family)
MSATITHLLRRLRRLAAPPGAESDSELLDRFARLRDEDAFAVLVARHGPMVLNACRRVLGDPHAAEDAFQATFLVLARKAASVRRPETLAGWLFGVASRVAREARRSRARQPCSGLAEPFDPPTSRPGPLAELAARDLVGVLQEEVQRLPEAYRLVVVLCCLEGLSQAEAARRLGCTPDSVRGRLERGRKRLSRRLAGRGLTLAAALGAVSRAAGGPPADVLASVVQAATRCAAGQAAGLVSLQVAALVEGGMKTMSLSRIKVALSLLLAAALAGGGGLARSPRAAEPGQTQGPAGAEPGKGMRAPRQERPGRRPEARRSDWADLERMFPDGRGHDFGKAPRGRVLTWSFRVVNLSGGLLHLTSVRVSSGCMTAVGTKKVLQPREAGKVTIKLDTRRFIGAKRIHLYLTTERPGEPAEVFTFRITARAEDGPR